MRKITKQQAAVLEFIKTYVAANGFPPARTDIQRHFGFASHNAAHEHVTALARKGFLQVTAGIPRGIKVLEAVQQ